MTDAQRDTIKSPDGVQIVSLDEHYAMVSRPATEADMRHCASCTCPVEAARTCRRCGERIVWHEGNGGQWIGEKPPRDWMTCFGRPEGEPHEPVEPAIRPEPTPCCPGAGSMAHVRGCINHPEADHG